MLHRVAITGLGIISSIGINLDEVTESLYTGRSGIIVDKERETLGFTSPLSGAIRLLSFQA